MKDEYIKLSQLIAPIKCDLCGTVIEIKDKYLDGLKHKICIECGEKV